MRIYEEIYIARPESVEEEIDALNGQLEALITQGGGKVQKIDKWGLRKLAYRVAKKNEGYYVLIVFEAGAAMVKEVERRLRVNDMVIKFLTVRMDEKLKWLEKRKKAREKRALRKPPPAAPLPAVPGAAPGAAPAMPGAPAVPASPAEAAPAPGAPAPEKQ
jgi:small subunit ribosomal protein S6